MTPILITGGNGFVGKHVKMAMDTAQISYLAPPSSQLNLLNFEAFSEYLAYHKPDTILHMAALCGGILANKNRPAEFLFANTQMALNVYEAARQNNITNIYSLGSVCAYGNYCPTPFKEDNIWQGGAPESTNLPYAQGKRTLMMLGETYREQYDFSGAHLIPVNMYGEFDLFDPINSHVIPAIIKKYIDAINIGAKHIECWGTDVGTTREFLYGGDCADAIVKTVSIRLDTPLPINLGTGISITIRDLALLIGKIMEYPCEIVFNGEVSNGQPSRQLNVDRAKQLLNWQATTSLEDGLRKTIDWYKSII